MLELCIRTGNVKINGEFVARLGHSETYLFAELINNVGQLITKEKLLDLGWQKKIVSSNSLTAAIKHIRKTIKLIEQDIVIETVYRRGYILHNLSDIDIILINKNADSFKDEEPVFTVNDSIVSHNTYNVNNQTSISWAIDDVTQKIINEGIGHKNQADSISDEKNIKSIFNVNHIRQLCLKIYLFLILIIAYIVYDANSKFFCITIKQANVCGVFELPTYKHARVTELIGDHTGNIYYGYNNNLDSIQVYQTD